MALRYKISPDCANARPKTKLRIPFAMHEPVHVKFRTKAPLEDVAREILASPIVDVSAPVGAGKSTRLPRILAKYANSVLYMVVPNPILATQLYNYVTTDAEYSRDGVESYLFVNGSEQIPERGIVYLSASTMTAVLISKGYGGEAIRGSVVFLDEAHESDAYSFVLRNLVVQMGATNLVRASATFGFEQESRPETQSEVREVKYDPKYTPDTWDVHANDMPWSYKRAGNGIVYIDSDSQAARLKRDYEDAGVIVHRLTSHSTDAQYELAAMALRDKYRKTILLVDYAYRSGFTFEVQYIIDSGYVYYMDATPGENKKCSRHMYNFERDQTRGRLGRTAGCAAVYYYPDLALEKIRVELEGVEAEAAAYLYRVLGFRPTPDLIHKVMSKLTLPASVKLSTALNAPIPLTCQVERNIVEPQEHTVEDAPEPVEAAIKHDVTDPPVERVAAEPLPDVVKTPEDVAEWYRLEEQARSVENMTLTDGVSYFPLSMPANTFRTYEEMFPEGLNSVVKFAFKYAHEDVLWPRLTEGQRKYVVSTLCMNYNMLIIEVDAMKKALMSILRDYDLDPANLRVREAVIEVSRESTFMSSQRSMLLRFVKKFLRTTNELKVFEGFTSLADDRYEFFRAEYEAVLSEFLPVSPQEYAQQMVHALSTVQIPSGLQHLAVPKVISHTTGAVEGCLDPPIQRKKVGFRVADLEDHDVGALTRSLYKYKGKHHRETRKAVPPDKHSVLV